MKVLINCSTCWRNIIWTLTGVHLKIFPNPSWSSLWSFLEIWRWVYLGEGGGEVSGLSMQLGQLITYYTPKKVFIFLTYQAFKNREGIVSQMYAQSPCTLINEFVHRLWCETKIPRSVRIFPGFWRPGKLKKKANSNTFLRV